MEIHSQWHGTTCPVCFEGTLCDGVRDEQITYKNAVFKWHQAGAYCPVCHDGIVQSDPSQDAVFAAFRDDMDARFPAAMEKTREKLGLSKADMLPLIGGGKNGYGRYITGHTKPTSAVINLMRALEVYPDLVEILKKPVVEVDADEAHYGPSASA